MRSKIRVLHKFIKTPSLNPTDTCKQTTARPRPSSTQSTRDSPSQTLGPIAQLSSSSVRVEPNVKVDKRGLSGSWGPLARKLKKQSNCDQKRKH